MILKNPRKHSEKVIFDTLNISFNDYLHQNNAISKKYLYQQRGNVVEIVTPSNALIVFTLITGDQVEIIDHTTDTLLFNELISYLSAELKIRREVLM